jgi:putative ubiquitin-RnfH superfamily antitoxin RatB of RatAB toxin-antitoxin module
VKVTLAIAWPDRQDVLELTMPPGSTVADAIAGARLAERYPGRDLSGLQAGIWSRACARDAALREGDRVELYRPLAADPKQMRRDRAQGAPRRG